MSFKDILVHMDYLRCCPARLALAIRIAKQHKAHLTGLFVISHSHYKPRRDSAKIEAAYMQSIFDNEIQKAGISAEWLCVDWPVIGVSMSEIVNMHAYHNDLVIVGQFNHSNSDDGTPADLPERLVIGSGRPVLIVPFSGEFKKVGERVMVAWKPGRESVRALNDAMPFLLEADQVTVLTINPSSSVESSDRSICDDVCLHLNRHGIRAITEQHTATDIPLGDMIINQASEEGCDLIVMGAFTNTQQRSLALSPVARKLLSHMTMPVLMAH